MLRFSCFWSAKAQPPCVGLMMSIACHQGRKASSSCPEAAGDKRARGVKRGRCSRGKGVGPRGGGGGYRTWM